MGSVSVVMTLICQDKAGKCFLYISVNIYHQNKQRASSPHWMFSQGLGAALRQIASSVHVVLMRSSKDSF